MLQLLFRLYFKGRKLLWDSHVLFADYNKETKKIKAIIQVDDQEINELYEKGVLIYATAKAQKWLEGTPREMILFTSLLLNLEPTPTACKLKEDLI